MGSQTAPVVIIDDTVRRHAVGPPSLSITAGGQVTTQPAFSHGNPSVLFEDAYSPTPRSVPNYDVSPDGQRFLMLKATEQAQQPTQINVVLNWFEELKRRVPPGGR